MTSGRNNKKEKTACPEVEQAGVPIDQVNGLSRDRKLRKIGAIT